jgi:hypothetical protein
MLHQLLLSLGEFSNTCKTNKCCQVLVLVFMQKKQLLPLTLLLLGCWSSRLLPCCCYCSCCTAMCFALLTLSACTGVCTYDK